MLSIQEEISTFSHEEDEWINFWENLALPCILEALSSDLSCEKRLVSTNVEAFSKITAFHLGSKYSWFGQKFFTEKNDRELVFLKIFSSLNGRSRWII